MKLVHVEFNRVVDYDPDFFNLVLRSVLEPKVAGRAHANLKSVAVCHRLSLACRRPGWSTLSGRAWSTTFLRNLTNSARSLSVTGVSGTSGTANAAACRIRSSLTHRLSILSAGPHREPAFDVHVCMDPGPVPLQDASWPGNVWIDAWRYGHR